MITHEEARKKSNELTFPYNMFFDEYIAHQENVAKLLKLYLQWVSMTYSPFDRDKIMKKNQST